MFATAWVIGINSEENARSIFLRNYIPASRDKQKTKNAIRNVTEKPSTSARAIMFEK